MPNEPVPTPTPDPTPPATPTPGNQGPPAPSNEPPKDAGPTDEAKAALAAAEKLVADNKALKNGDMVPDAEEQRVAAEKLAAEEAAKALADADADKENAPLDLETWGSTGHEGGDAVLGLLQNAGVTPDEAKALLFDAVTAGDLSKIDRTALEAKIGKDKTVLVLAGATSFLADKTSRNTQIVKDIKDVAGGEENWSKVAAWAKAGGNSVSDDQMSEYIEMIDNGGAQARFAANELVTAYNADDKNTTLQSQGVPPVIEGDTSNTPGGRSLTRNQYAAEVAKLHVRGRIPTDAEMTALSQARARGRAA